MELRRLERDALFISMELSVPRQAWVLPKGTAVIPLPNAPSPVSGAETELYVSAPDCINRVWRGWLAHDSKLAGKPTPLEKGMNWVGKRKTIRIGEQKQRLPIWVGPGGRALETTAWDQLRERIVLTAPRDGIDKQGRPIHPWTIFPWLCRFGAVNIPLLRAALQHLTRKDPRTNQPDELTRRLMKVTVNRVVSIRKIQVIRKKIQREEEHRRALALARLTERQRARQLKLEVKEKKTMRASKKSTQKTAAPKRSMARTVGQALLKLKASSTHGYAKRLVNGGLPRKDLVKLRNVINEAASTAREKKQSSLASALSGANRLVRRMERAAR